MTKAASISEQSQALLESNRAFVTIECQHSKPCESAYNLTFPTPCSIASSVQESTSTLLAARSYAKMGLSKAAWDALDALFVGSQALIPRYRYFHANDDAYFVQDTTIPNWRAFDPFGTNKGTSVVTSNRLSSLPIHASLVLETFYLTNQTQDDLDGLERAFWHLWNHHEYLHTVVLRLCPGKYCYNIIHPWESDEGTIPPEALQKINEQILRVQWQLPLEIPYYVRNSWNFDNETFPAMIFLLECQFNATRNCQVTFSNKTLCEDTMIQSCPFSMLNVGHAAALVQSNRDLQIMADILVDAIAAPSKPKLLQLAQWEASSKLILDSLWHDPSRSFLPRIESQWIVRPEAANFWGLWSTIDNASWLGDMTFHLMQHEGDFAFDCGKYPLWSSGGCKSRASISTELNYFLSRGMKRNGMNGLEHYLNISTINLLCQSENNDEQDGRCDHISFASAFDASTNLPFRTFESCSSSWTATAAIAYNLVIPDKDFSYTPPPPIRASWVIVLVFAELIVAFAMGMSCLVLSLSLMKRLNDVVDDDDLRDNVMLWDTTSLDFFSAADSVENSETAYGIVGNILDQTLLVGYNEEDYASKS